MKKQNIFFVILIILALTAGCITSSGRPHTNSVKYPTHAPNLLYEVHIKAPHTHNFEISITIEKPVGKYIDFAMPAWSPGRYIIYNFAKHVSHVEVFSENAPALRLIRLDKQTWRISGYEGNTFTLHYRVYANYMSGTFSQLTSEGALINGASVFMYIVNGKTIPIRLTLCLPEKMDWNIATGIPAKHRHTYYADNYEHLIDSPISIGHIREYSFKSFEKPIHICFQSPLPETVFEKQLALHCKTLCDSAKIIFGEFPFSKYYFIFHSGFTPGMYDGMEHMNSCCITETKTINTENHLKKMITLAAHEFIHVWNIKCIRPYEFLSYDLTKETYTNSLWIVEGLTRYYQNVLQLRAGLISREKFRINFTYYISTYESKPGRNVMTLEEASFLTWVDHCNEEDMNRVNTRISYYNKGAVVGLLLDMKIRGLTNGHKGLDDVFRSMYKTYYKKNKGYSTEDFYLECEKIAGKPLKDFFNRCAKGLDPLPYAECAEQCGFILKNGKRMSEPFFGFKLDNARITQIIPGSSAENAGLQKYDEIKLIDGYPFYDIDDLFLKEPGEKIEITVLRYGKEITLPLVVGEKVPVYFIFNEKPLIDKEIAGIREAFYTGQKTRSISKN